MLALDLLLKKHDAPLVYQTHKSSHPTQHAAAILFLGWNPANITATG